MDNSETPTVRNKTPAEELVSGMLGFQIVARSYIEGRMNAAFTELDTRQREIEQAVPSANSSIEPAKQSGNECDDTLEFLDLLEKRQVAVNNASAAMDDASRLLRVMTSAMNVVRSAIAQRQSSDGELSPEKFHELIAAFKSMIEAAESLVVEHSERAGSDETQSHTN